MKDYEAIIIGAGQAGPGIAMGFAREGRKTALIEKDRVGGTCLNYGCRPTKTLRKSAEVAHMARRAAEYGIKVGPVEVDFQAVMARKNKIIGGMQDGYDDYITKIENLDLFRGEGAFAGKEGEYYVVQVNGEKLRSKEVYLNVGARAFIPPIEGIENVPYLTERGILALDVLPEHLLVVGAGYIGLEFAQMFRRFGSRVTIVETAARLMPKQDEDVCGAVTEIFQDEGVEVLTGSRAVAASGVEGDIKVTLKKDDGEQVETACSHLLLSTGRVPNTDKLNLESIGLETDDKGYIPVNGRLETKLPNLWALGDVNRRGAFTHTAYQEYEILKANLKGGNRSADDRILASVLFVDPPMGHVGLTESQAKDRGINLLVNKLPMKRISRAALDSTTEGLFKILVDADSEKIVGCTILGAQGDDVVAIVSNFMATGANYKVMRDALPVHPTVGEFLPTLLNGLKPAK